jgi:hypothetical protein
VKIDGSKVKNWVVIIAVILGLGVAAHWGADKLKGKLNAGTVGFSIWNVLAITIMGMIGIGGFKFLAGRSKNQSLQAVAALV